MREDPLQEDLLARAVAEQRLDPHAVHAPPTFKTERNKTYDPARAGGRPPDGRDGPGPYWMLQAVVRHNGLVRCPDCGRVLIAAHDLEVERAGFNFLVCWDLQRPYRLPASVQPCHEGCVVACGRSVAVGT
jgi:hypothetical protein